MQKEDLKYVQVYDLDDCCSNRRVYCSYDLRLQIKKKEVTKFYFFHS
jgi:hypothetical protein